MKKLIPIILATALTLAACASAPDTASTPLANSTPEPTAATTPAPTTAPFYPVANSYNNGDTYYAFVHRGEDSLLLKTDYAAATQTVNCAGAFCRPCTASTISTPSTTPPRSTAKSRPSKKAP